MGGDVADYCKKCDVCQRVNNRLGRTKAELHPIPVTAVWDQIGIDLIGTIILLYGYDYFLVNT